VRLISWTLRSGSEHVHIGDDGHTGTDNRGLVKDKQEKITDTQALIKGYIQIAETLG
jgi:hypothetical protein